MGKRAYCPRDIRTLAIVGHRSSGKTSLAEALLTTAGVTRRLGRVDERSSLLDNEPAERRRGMSLRMSFAWMQWADRLVQLIDTPGSEGLRHEQNLGLTGADAALLVVSASDGVEFGTE